MNFIQKKALPIISGSKQNFQRQLSPDLHPHNNPTLSSEEKKYFKYIQCVGVVRGQWLKPNGKLESICYGSGIAVSKRIILTCAHCVYTQKKRKKCQSISFIPSFINGQPNINKKVFKSSKQQFVQLQPLQQNQLFSKCPIAQDIALVYLEQELQLDWFPQIGMQEQKIEQGMKIIASGFPSKTYYTETQIQKITFKRQTLSGTQLQVQGDIIYHDLQTQTGHSGSAIFAINSMNPQGTIIGVHTHKGKRRNMGVFLNENVLKKLALFEAKFGSFHKQYEMDIKFSKQIKQSIYNSLTDGQKELLKTRELYHSSMNQTNNQEKQVQTNQNGSSSSQQFKLIDNKQSSSKRIIRLLQQNFIRKKDLAGSLFSPKSQQIFLKWLQIQNSFLTSFQTFINITQSQKQQIFETFQKHLSDFQQRVQRCLNKPNQLIVIKYKFPTVEWHLKHVNQFYIHDIKVAEQQQINYIDECFTNLQQQSCKNQFDGYYDDIQNQLYT